MNGSLIAADRATHLKIILLALAAVLVMVLIATHASSTTRAAYDEPKVKAERPLLTINSAVPRPRA